MTRYAIALQDGAYLSARSSQAYEFGTGDFTLEAWIRRTTGKGGGTILSRMGSKSGNGNGGWLLRLQPDGALGLVTDGGFGSHQAISNAPAIGDSVWHHVAAVRAGGALSIYVDGGTVPVTVSGAATPTNVNNAGPLLAGAPGEKDFARELDELRVWNVARSAAQITASMGQRLTLPQLGLVGYWGVYYPKLEDLLGTGNSFDVVGRFESASTCAPVLESTYAVRLKSPAYLAAASHEAYNFGTGDFTLEAWVCSRQGGTILSCSGGSAGQRTGGWRLVLQPDGRIELANDGGTSYHSVTPEPWVLNGSWHHVAAVRSSGRAVIYVDGVLPVHSELLGSLWTDDVTKPLRLLAGATDQGPGPCNWLDGDLDELRVWNVARTADQIAIYRGQQLPPRQSGLVGHWTFDACSFADSSLTGNAFEPQDVPKDFDTLVALGVPLESTPLAAPTLQQTKYNGEVSLQWEPVADLRLEGYKVRAFEDGKQVSEDQMGASWTSHTINTMRRFDPSKACTVRVQAVGRAFASEWSAAMPVVMQAPKFASVDYDGACVSASWPEVAGATLYMLAVSDGKEVVGSKEFPKTEGSVTDDSVLQGSVKVTLDPMKTYTVRVRASGACSGPESEAVPVILMAPQVKYVAYAPAVPYVSPAGVSATWFPVTGAGGYRLTLCYLNEPMFSNDNDNGNLNGVVQTELNTGLDEGVLPWNVRVRATKGVSIGPESVAVAVIVDEPSIESVIYDHEYVSAWFPPVAGAKDYTIALYDGATFQRAGTSGAPPVKVEAAALDTTKTYTVRVRATNGVSKGPEITAEVIAATPTMTEVRYDGKEVTASWSYIQADVRHMLTLYRGDEEIDTIRASGSGKFKADLDPTETYTLRVHYAVPVYRTDGMSSGPRSVPVTVISAAPKIESVSCDGSNVSASWSKVGGDAVTGYTITVYREYWPSTTAENIQALQWSAEASLDPPSKSYTVRVRATGVHNTGPESEAVMVIAAAPTIASVSYDGKHVHAQWSAVTGVSDYVVALYQGTTALSVVVDMAGTQATIEAELDLAKTYTLRVHAIAPGTVGPQSEPVTVIVGEPTITSVRCSGPAGTAVAAAPLGSGGVAAAGSGSLTVAASLGPIPGTGVTMEAVLYTDGVAGTRVEVVDGTARLPMGSGGAFAVAVRAHAGVVVTGPWSPPVPAVTAAPTAPTARYASGTLAAAWVGSPGVSYWMCVSAGDGVVEEKEALGPAGTIAFAATPGTAYSLSVFEVAGVATGPAARLPLVTEGCAITSLAVGSGRTATVEWEAPAHPPAIDQVQPVVTWGGAETAFPAQPSGASPLRLALPARVPNGAALTLRAIAGGAAGPDGNAVPLLTTAPEDLQLSFENDVVVATWSAAPGAEVDGYEVTLAATGALPFTTATRVRGLSARIAYTPTPGNSATVTVAATSGVAIGPAGSAVPVITAAPALTKAVYDGRTLALGVAASAGATPTGYDVVLLRDGEAVQSETRLLPTDGRLRFPVEVPVDPSSAYSVAINVRAGTSTGPAAAAAVLLATPLVSGVFATAGSGLLTVDASLGPIPGTGVTMEAVLYTDGVAGERVAVVDGTARLPMGRGAAFAVAVRVHTGAVVAGPWSPLVPAVTAAPTAPTARYASGALAATWGGSAGGSYRMRVSAGDAVVAEAAASGPAGTIAFAATPGTAYSLSVFEVAGVATGPAATLPLVTDGCAITSVAVGPRRTATVEWEAPAHPPAIDQVQPVVSWGGAETALPALAPGAGPLRLPLPAWVPNGAALTLRAVAGGSTGPGGNAVPLPTTAPRGLRIAFADNVIEAAWSAAPDVEADGYVVTLAVTGASPSTTRTPVPGPSARIAYTPASGDSATVSVAAASGMAIGPAASAVPVITAAPALATSAFDGRTLTLGVTAPAGAPPTGYDVALLRDGEAVQSATLLPPAHGTLRFPVEVPVDPAGAYSVAVIARAGTSAGPAATATVLLAAPLVTAVAATAGSGSLAVAASLGPIPGTGVTMESVLYSDGVPGNPVEIVDGTAQLEMGSGGVFTVAVRVRADGATGPWSPPIPAITATPTAPTARYASETLAAAWGGSADASYRMRVSDCDGAVAEAAASGPAGTINFAATPGTAYTLCVFEVAGVATGPAATLPLVTEGCAITSVAVGSDRTATVEWEAPAHPPVIDQVQPVVSWGGAETALPAQPADAGALTLALPAWVPNGAALTLRAVTDGATGPDGNAAPLPTTAPGDLQVSFANDVVVAAWSEPPGAEVDGYVVTLAVTGTSPSTTATRVSGLSARIPYTPADLAAATVSVAAASGVAIGPAGAAVPVISAAPALTKAVYDGTSVALGWTPAADGNVTGTVVSLLTGGVVTEQVTMGGIGGSIALPPGAWTARVQGAGMGTVGPAPQDVALLTAPPPCVTVGWDALGTGCAVTWTAMAGVAAYEVLLTDGGSPVASFVVSAPDADARMAVQIPAATFTPHSGSFAVSMRTLDGARDPVAVGPPGPVTEITAAAPVGVSVAYDGVTAVVSWNAVASPLVTGYQLSSVVGPTASPLGQTTGTSAAFALTVLDPAAAPSIVVQALCGPAMGPPSAQAPVLAQGLFLSTGSGVAPNLAPRTAPSSAATSLVLYLPQIFQKAPKAGELPTEAPFEMAPLPDSPFAYTLTIGSASAAWRFTAEDRAAVRAAYASLLAALAGQTATAPGLRTVQDAISRAMPQTFAETLFYAYGLNAAKGWVDLRPGMVLRAEFETYQVPGTQVKDGAFVAGFVATGTAEYEVSSYLGGDGQWLTGFDAFLATLAAAQGIRVPTLASDGGRAQGAGGLIDAFFPQFQKPFCRIVYPGSTLTTDSTGSAYPFQNPVLLASDSLANLDTAATNVREGLAPGGSVASFYFRGRTTLTACVRVLVNGAPMLVPVGTTVGNLLASFAARPPLAGLPLRGVTLLRPFGAAVLCAGGADGYPVGGGWNVRLDWCPDGSNVAGSDWLELPVLHGDRLSFGER
jgi:hypothetical protein